MKILKRVISISICIMMLISSMIMMQTAAVSSVWTGSGTTTKQLAGNYEGWTEVTYSKDTDTTINYGENINLVQGAKFEFILVTGKFKASNGVRNSDTNKIRFVFESGSNSIIVVFRALYENTAANINKIQVDVLYKTGSVTTIEESYEIAQNVINVKHSVSIKKESDHYFIIVDGVSAIPLSKYSDLNFSSTTLKAEIKTTADNPNIRLSPVSNQTDSVLYGQWSTFGVTQVSTNEDLTTRYKVDDKISDLYDTEGASRVREALVNHTGYDVNKPIIIEASMSVVNVPAVWWGVGLSRKPYDYHSRRAYDENGNIIEEKDFGSNILNYCGLMFQAVTGKVQPQQENLQPDLKDFITNASVNGYAGRDDLDTFVFEIGDAYTTFTFNGVVLYTTLEVKKSDFPDGKAYPFFHFIETPASPTKYNEITIKGVNAPKVLDEKVDYPKGSNQDLVINLDNRSNGTLTVYKDKNLQSTASSSFSGTKLTLNKSLFSGVDVGEMVFYAKNNGGIEEIKVNIYDPSMVMQSPVVGRKTYYWEQGIGANNLTIDVDVKNGEFQRLIGAGITSTRYTVQQKQGSIYTITINKDWLNGKEVGDLKFTIETINPQNEEEKKTDTFTVSVVYDLPSNSDISESDNFSRDSGSTSSDEYSSDDISESGDMSSNDSSLSGIESGVSNSQSESQSGNNSSTDSEAGTKDETSNDKDDSKAGLIIAIVLIAIATTGIVLLTLKSKGKLIKLWRKEK